MDVARREADLEARDARKRAGGGANLRWIVRERRDIVAEEGGGGGELTAGELHPIARIAGESNRDSVELGDVFGAVRAAL
jgi:hypothetical protein